MAALVEGGHFDSTFCGCLGFYLRAMTCNTLPLSVGHLTHVSVKRSFTSIGFPDESVPFALKVPVAMAISPNTVTFCQGGIRINRRPAQSAAMKFGSSSNVQIRRNYFVVDWSVRW